MYVCVYNNKAPGESGILPEMVCHGGDAFFSALLSLVQQVWHDRCVPQAWRDAELVPIPKKGDLSSCDNWRGIALLDVVGKLVGRLIHSRLQLLAESELTDSQCGFAQIARASIRFSQCRSILRISMSTKHPVI